MKHYNPMETLRKKINKTTSEKAMGLKRKDEIEVTVFLKLGNPSFYRFFSASLMR